MGNKNPKCYYKKCNNRVNSIMIIMDTKNKCSNCQRIFCNKHRLPETHNCISKQELSQEEKEQHIITAIETLSVNPNKRKIDKI